MKHFTLDEHWGAIQGQLQQRYSHLNDADFASAEGDGQEMLARLREKLGLSATSFETLLEELHAEAGGTLAHVRARLGEVADGVKSRAAAVGEEAKAQAQAAYGQARQEFRSWHADLEQHVRRNPRESLIAAVCAGFVAGLLIRR